MLGIFLQSSMIISFVFSIIVSILWFFSDAILIFLRQDPKVATLAGLYLKYLAPGLFAYGFIQCLLRFLQTQTVVMPLVICSIFPLLINAGFAYLFVYHTPLGYKGAPLAATVSLWVSFIMLAVYVNFSKNFSSTWKGLSLESFYHILPSLRLAIPSAIMVW